MSDESFTDPTAATEFGGQQVTEVSKAKLTFPHVVTGEPPTTGKAIELTLANGDKVYQCRYAPDCDYVDWTLQSIFAHGAKVHPRPDKPKTAVQKRRLIDEELQEMPLGDILDLAAKGLSIRDQVDWRLKYQHLRNKLRRFGDLFLGEDD